MPENIRQSDFNKNVIQVYTQEANFTGYKGFDFTAIDDLEYLIRQELIPYASGIKSSIENGVNTNQLDLNYITDSVSISGGALSYLSGIANQGINVNQLDLNYATDNVSISGQALSYLSGIALEGVSLKGVNTVNVNVTGGSLNVLNEVEIKNALNNPVPVSGTVMIGNLGDGITTFWADNATNDIGNGVRNGLGSHLDDVGSFPVAVVGVAAGAVMTIAPVRTSEITNYTINTNVGEAIAVNPDRQELYVQNLSNNILYVKYGSTASSSSFNFILSANSVVDAGDGGILSDENYNGTVSVSGVSPRFIAWERISNQA